MRGPQKDTRAAINKAIRLLRADPYLSIWEVSRDLGFVKNWMYLNLKRYPHLRARIPPRQPCPATRGPKSLTIANMLRAVDMLNRDPTLSKAGVSHQLGFCHNWFKNTELRHPHLTIRLINKRGKKTQ